jgi:hypothetical protein
VLDSLRLTYRLGEQIVFDKKLEMAYKLGSGCPWTYGDSWGVPVQLGNLLSFHFWYLLAQQPKLKVVLPEFSIYHPFSYYPLDGKILHGILSRSTKHISVLPPKTKGRCFFNQALLKIICTDILKWDNETVLKHLKSIYDFKLPKGGRYCTKFGDEIAITADQFDVLETVAARYCGEHHKFLESNPTLFTRENLLDSGLSFDAGCFYESSGYGLHLFYLPDVQSTFVFRGDFNFQEIWYAFVSLLTETGYFENDEKAYAYLGQLEQSIVPYAWMNVDLSSTL